MNQKSCLLGVLLVLGSGLSVAGCGSQDSMTAAEIANVKNKNLKPPPDMAEKMRQGAGMQKKIADSMAAKGLTPDGHPLPKGGAGTTGAPSQAGGTAGS